MHMSTLLVQTFRDLLQPGEHLGQFLLPLSQLASTREVYSEQSHDGVDDLNRREQTRRSFTQRMDEMMVEVKPKILETY